MTQKRHAEDVKEGQPCHTGDNMDATPRFLRLTAGFVVAASASALSASQATYVSTPEDAQQAFSSLNGSEQAQLSEQLSGLLGQVDFAGLLEPFLPQPQAQAEDDLLGDTLDPLGLGAVNDLLDLVLLLPGALNYTWEYEMNGQRGSASALLNLPTPIDVDGNGLPDITATLSISGTNQVTMTVDRLGARLGLRGLLGSVLGNNPLPLKIEAVIADPRSESDALFALGYDASANSAPEQFSAAVNLSGALDSSQIGVNLTTKSPGDSLTLLAGQFNRASDGQREPSQELAMSLSPVPARANVDVTLGDQIAVALGATQRSTADILFVNHASQPAQVVTALIEQLPTSLNLSLAENQSDRVLSYSGSSDVDLIHITADGVGGLFGNTSQVDLELAQIPTDMSLSFGSSGDFDLDLGDDNLGRIEALLTNGPDVRVPAGMDGVTLLEIPGTSVLTARISGLKRVTAQQAPLALALDSVAGNPLRVELREQPSASAKQTYTIAELSSIQRHTEISIDESGGAQRIRYRADDAASSLSFSTNAGDRHQMTASAAPVASSIDICAAGGTACTTSGKSANTGSFRVITSQPVNLNLRDCDTVSCGNELRLTNLSIRHLDLAINISENCTIFGCITGSKGSIWLDTDNYNLTGGFRSRSSDFNVNGFFGSGFRTNNRYVSWNNFIPSKSGSISCGSGTFLDVTVIGITIDVSGLYLC